MEWDEQTVTHFKEHITKWPATGEEILTACNNMEHVPEHDKEMVNSMIDPEKTYNSLDELMEDLNK